MTVSLIERDWFTTMILDDQASAFEAAFKIGGSVVGAVSSCIGSGGFGCLLSIGGAIKTIIDTLFGLSQKPTTVTVKDPEDSDIDIVIISKDFQGISFLDRGKIVPLRRKIDVRIEPVPYRPEKFNEGDPLAAEVMANGEEINL